MGIETKVDTPVQFLKGVGPHLGKALHRRGISTLGELIEWYPRGYQDRRAAISISSLKIGDIVSLKAKVVGVRSVALGKSKRRMWDIIVRDSSGTIRCKYFRTPYKGYFERFQPDQAVRVEGKVTLYRGSIEFHHPDLRDDVEDLENLDHVIPLYTETEGLSPSRLQKIMRTAFEGLKGKIPETLPKWLLNEFRLPNREEALKNIHIPPPNASRSFIEGQSEFHRRIKFEEFFWMQLVVMARRSRLVKQEALAMTKDPKSILQPYLGALGFELTTGQEAALVDIFSDLKKPTPMHRLIQGDVGSGKTAVSFLGSAYVLAHGYQCALMAPTEILAEQHFVKAKELFSRFGFRVELLTGKTKKAEREAITQGLSSGDVHFVIGTHALIQEDVEFRSLAFAIIDEQHRFGVHQRRLLKTKGLSPHFLVMTATPIPRSLSMTLYGDLDVSVIKTMPKGRIPIVTRVTFESQRRKVLDFTRQQVLKGRQVYFVLPLVEESEKIDLKDAVSEFEELKAEFKDISVGLVHGKMKSEEKDLAMEKFRSGEIKILVSTTVIEVGVDVPNANMIVVMHAERFGLSQLHQLRGRVGRGLHKSYCVLVLGKAVSEEARERVKVMEQTNDGFEIADKDLEIRGPGDFLGTRQSGLEGFKLANMVRDIDILVEARKAAQLVLERDSELKTPENQMLRKELEKSDGHLALATSG